MATARSNMQPPKVRKLARPVGMTVAHVIEAMGDTVGFEYQGDPEQLFRGVATTTRAREVRRRFWVIKDRDWTRYRFDPYRESETTREEDLAKALELGAEGIICGPEFKGLALLEGSNVFFTPNTIDFTCRLIEAQRRLYRGRRTIAVTGSAGKTTTSAMVAHALQAIDEKAKVQYSSQNRNYLHWVLAHQSRAHRFDHTVLEVSGATLSYEWEDWAVSADVAVVTTIAEAHLDHHGSLEGVARDKSNIFKAPPRDGAAVINADTSHAAILIARAEAEGSRVITYGEAPGADIRLTAYDAGTGRVRANVVGLDVEYTLLVKGKHMALNSLAVLAALRDLGLDWAKGTVALESFRPPSGRGQEFAVALPGGGQFTLIDGSYNANPASVKASLQWLADADTPGRKIAVLGDILELGDHAHAVHASLVDEIRSTGLDVVHLLGEHLHAMHDEASDLGAEVHRWADVTDLIRKLPGMLEHEDIVLIKGSGGTGLKGLAKTFLEESNGD